MQLASRQTARSGCPLRRRLTGPSSPHMRMRGLEPPRPERHTDLNRARLPIPPHPRADDSSRQPHVQACCTETAAPDRRHTHHDPHFRTPLRPRASAASPARRRDGPAQPGDRAARARSSSRSRPRRSPVDRSRAARPRARRSTASRHGSRPRSARRSRARRIRWRYRIVLNGAAVVVPRARVAALRALPGVTSVDSGAAYTARQRTDSRRPATAAPTGRPGSRTRAPG